jgi:hypothetical protein
MLTRYPVVSSDARQTDDVPPGVPSFGDHHDPWFVVAFVASLRLLVGHIFHKSLLMLCFELFPGGKNKSPALQAGLGLYKIDVYLSNSRICPAERKEATGAEPVRLVTI